MLWSKYMRGRLGSIGLTSMRRTKLYTYVHHPAVGSSIIAIHVDTVTVVETSCALDTIRRQLHELFEMKEEDPS